MSLTVSVPGVVRPVGFGSFSDLTAIPVVNIGTANGITTVTFATDLPQAVFDACTARLQSATSNEETIRAGIAASITALKADIDQANLDIAATNATINANPAAYIKNIDRALKNADRAVLRLLKIASASYSDTDLGAA